MSVSFILGGARSGKSARALVLAAASPKVFVATAQALDDEMADRIARHQQERGAEWDLIEEPLDLVGVISGTRHGVLVIDCLTLWLSNLIHHDRDLAGETTRLIAALGRARADIVLVSNEVGLSIAPVNTLARRFRDEQGRLNQAVAAASDRVEFIAAGLPLVMKDRT